MWQVTPWGGKGIETSPEIWNYVNDGDRENNGNDQIYVTIAFFITLNTPYTVVPHKWTRTWC